MKNKLKHEVWRVIKDFPDYQISNHGRVKSFKQSNNGKIRKLATHRQGYKEVVLKSDSERKIFKVHRLVAIYFINNPENKSEINHKDGNKSNNYEDNLIWSTRSENQQHAFDTGLQIGLIGSKNPASKISEIDVLYIRKSELSINDLMIHFCLSKSAVSNIKRLKSWSHIK